MKRSKTCLWHCLMMVVAFSVMSLMAAPPVIDDQKIADDLVKATSEMVGKDGVPTADALAEQAKKVDHQGVTRAVAVATTVVGNDYEALSRSVYLIDSIYKCGKCDHWHQGSTATAWCLDGNGLMVTNAHVFRNAKGEAMGVINREGKMFPVVELLGWDVATDVAVFRVNGKGMTSLKLGEAPAVGSGLSIISNPSGNLFVRTEGAVSRYAMRQMESKTAKVAWMEVTADYAVGSSGGPVFNAAGEVVGMVSSTRSIYTGGPGKAPNNTKGDLQMVIKNCVPVDAIRALIKK